MRYLGPLDQETRPKKKLSDNVLLEFKGNEVKSFLLDIPFPGTIVNMRFNFNDSNNYCMTSELEPIDMENLL